MLTKHSRVAVAGLAIVVFGSAVACECSDAGPFLDVAQSAALIVRGKVVAHVEHGLDVQIQDVYRGEESRRVIRVWGDNGRACRPYASRFADESEWVFAVSRLSAEGALVYGGESAADFEIWSCGEYALQVSGNLAKSVDGSVHKTLISFEELRGRIDAWAKAH